MRKLHTTLAALFCWEASWRLGNKAWSSDDRVPRLILAAADHLVARALSRDPRQIWCPILGAPDNLPAAAFRRAV
jgi:hypothetical protein